MHERLGTVVSGTHTDPLLREGIGEIGQVNIRHDEAEYPDAMLDFFTADQTYLWEITMEVLPE